MTREDGRPRAARGELLLTLAHRRLNGTISIFVVRVDHGAGKPRFVYEVVDAEDLDLPPVADLPGLAGEDLGSSFAEPRPQRENARDRLTRIARASFYHRQRPDRPILVLDCVPLDGDEWASKLGDDVLELKLALRVPITDRIGFFAVMPADRQHVLSGHHGQVAFATRWVFDRSARYIKDREASLYGFLPNPLKANVLMDDVQRGPPSKASNLSVPPVDGGDPAGLAIFEALSVKDVVRGRPSSRWDNGRGRPYPERRLYFALVEGTPLPPHGGGDVKPPTLELAGIRRVGFLSPVTVGGPGKGDEAARLPFRPRLRAEPVPERLTEAAGHTLVVRQPPLACIERRRPEDPVVWLAALQGFGGQEILKAWNRDVVETYHAAVRSVRPDRAISLLPKGSTAILEERSSVREAAPGESRPSRADSWTLVFRVSDQWRDIDAEQPLNPPEAGELEIDLVRVMPGDLGGLYPTEEKDRQLDPLWLRHNSNVPAWVGSGARAEDYRLSLSGTTPRWRDHRGVPLNFEFQLLGGYTPDVSARPQEIERLRALAWSREKVRREAPYGKAEPDADPRTLPMPPAIEFQVEDIRPTASCKSWVRLGAFEVWFAPPGTRPTSPEANETTCVATTAAAAKTAAAEGEKDREKARKIWKEKIDRWKQVERGDPGRVEQGDRPFDVIRVWWRRGEDEPGHALHLNLDVLLPVAGIRPASQDPPESETERDDIAPPLLLPISPATIDPEVFGLSFQEWTTEVEKQQLALHLFSTNEGAPVRPGALLVLDTEPFLVAKVEMRDLRPTGDNNRLAYFDSDQGESPVWLVRAEREGYTLLLPPQAVGETALKRPAGIADHELPDEPAPPDQRVADFRFSPPARLQILTVVRGDRREAVEPPFNTRRIFGDPLSPERGAPLLTAEFELLYGLSATVRPRGAQLVELTAELGAPPRLLADGSPRWDRSIRGGERLAELDEQVEYRRQLDRYRVFRDHWREVHEAYRRRLAVLTVMRAGERPQLTEGVHFELRREAEIRRPTPPPTDPVDQFSPYTKVGEKLSLGRPRVDKADWGLAGGADWGFESTGVYEEVWRRPGSDHGELADLHFSALGGWGRQKAVFAGGKTAIISRTGMGRAHFYSLERLGRIGVFWNRCKHVIVYERTVLPSDQFGAVQPGHHGRPILRKVREFVEVLEPERRYPEAGGTAQQCGPVEAIVFRSTVIPVDSSWGVDLPGAGWKVPLWRPGAEPASVYRKPQVELRLAGDPRGGGGGKAAAGCSEPQNLFFFTSTRPGDGEDTDAWRAVEGVDWVLLPDPSAPGELKTGHDGRQPSDVPVPPGFGPCTFALEPLTETAANLNVGRESAPLRTEDTAPSLAPATVIPATPPSGAPADQAGAIGAVLRSVTMSRGVGSPPPDNRLGELWDKNVSALHRVAVEAEAIASEVQKAGSDVGTLAKTLTSSSLKDLGGLGEQLKAREAEIASQLGIVGDLSDPCVMLDRRIDEVLDAALTSFKSAFRGPEALLDRLEGDLASVAALTEVEGNPSAVVPMDPKEAIDRLKGRLLTLTDGWFASAGLLIGTIRTPLSQLRAALPERPAVDLHASLTGEVAAFQRRLLAAAPDPNRLGQEPDYTGGTLEAEERSLLAAFDTLADQLLTEARRLLPKAAAELDARRRGVRAELASKLAEARGNLGRSAVRGAQAWRAEVEKVATELNGKLAPIKADGEFGKTLGDLSRKLKDGVNGGEAELAKLADALATAHQAVRTAIQAIEVMSATGALALIGKETETLVGRVEKDLDKPSGVIRTKAKEKAHDLCQNIIGTSFERLRKLPKELAEGEEALRKLIEKKLSDLGGDLNKVLDELGLRDLNDLGSLGAQLAEQVRSLEQLRVPELILAQAGESGIRLLRAFGDAPVVPGLEFNRERLGYYFDQTVKNIGLTPTAALFDRAGQELKGLGLRLPTTELVERFLPKLDGLKIGDLFPDFAGIKLDKLFEGVVPAVGSGDRLHVTHGFDKDTKRGWIDAVVDKVEVGESAPLFEFAGLALRLDNGTFDARARLEADAGGAVDAVAAAGAAVGAGAPAQPAASQAPAATPKMQRTATGTIAGDWVLGFGGKTLVTFRDTPLSFDEGGRLDFGIKAANTELSPELSFLDQFLKGTRQDAGAGVNVGLLVEGGVPSGVECLLDLPVPPLAAGTFCITGMRFVTGMQVRALPKFSVTLHAALGSAATPFTITVFILGGTGWVQCWGRYTPDDGQIESSVSVAIGVSAQLGLAFGPISGDVQLVLAIKAEMRSSSRASGRVNISILMIARGQVDVAGLITAALLLMLEVRFEEGQRVIGEGTASFSIRMGPFYTWRIAQKVTYRLAGTGGSGGDEDGAARHMQAQA